MELVIEPKPVTRKLPYLLVFHIRLSISCPKALWLKRLIIRLLFFAVLIWVWWFDGAAHRVADAAIARGGTIYTSRAHGLYIDVLFDNVAAGRSPGSVVVLRDAERPPRGGLYAGLVGDCPQCSLLDQTG